MLFESVPGVLLLLFLTLVSFRPELLFGRRPLDDRRDGENPEAGKKSSTDVITQISSEHMGIQWKDLSWEQRLAQLEAEPSRGLRRSIFRALFNLEVVGEDEALLQLLNSNDSHLVALALQYGHRRGLNHTRFPLTVAQGPSALERALTRFADGWGRVEDAISILNTAQRLRQRELEPLVLNLGTRDSTQLRAELVDYLADMGTPQSLPLVREIAARDDDSWETRTAARKAIKRIIERADLPDGQLTLIQSEDVSGALSTTDATTSIPES